MTTLDNIQKELDKFLNSQEAKCPEQRLIILDAKKICYKYDLYGNFIDEYKSITEAAKSINVGKDKIRRTLKGELKTTNNHIFLYEKYDKIPNDILNERLTYGHYNRFTKTITYIKKKIK